MSFYSTTGTAFTTAAETAKTAAETAKTAAEAAQAATELLHDDFDDRYLGSKASDPAVDNDGNALAAGTMYFNTTSTKMRVYSGSSWADITAVQGALITGNNLSDLTDDGAARTNLGLGTAATTAATDYATAAQADQTVALTASTGITVSGTYPNFSITNSAPDQTVALTAGGATSISGTYPNFTISSTNTTYNVGNNGLTEVNFTSALNTKLAGIETSADVTDTTNVVAALTAGSNITIGADGTIAAPVSGITYSNSWVDSGSNALLRLTPSTGTAQDITLAAGSNVTLTPSGTTLTIASSDTTYSVTDGQLSQNNFTDADHSKLDSVASSADVTDATSVAAAGAVMKTFYSANSFLYSTSSNNPESKNATQVRSLLNVEDGANNYVHPTHDGDDIDIDTTALSGATVISDLDFNVTTDTLGHVVDANASVATRNLTLANLGYTGSTDATTNDTDANLKNRANHTGSQAISTVTGLQSALDGKQDSFVLGINNNSIVKIDSTSVADDEYARFTSDGLESRSFAEVRSDINVANGATANDTDANLKARANHTGTQAISTVSGLQSALDAKQPNVTFGIANTNGVKIDSADVADNEFAKFTANGLEGRTAAEMRTDLNVANGATSNDNDANLKARGNHTGTQGQNTIDNLVSDLAGKQATLTFGIQDTNALKVDQTASDNDYAKFTSTGIEGRTIAEMLLDLNVEDGAQPTSTAAVTAAGAVMDSELDSEMGIKTLDVPVNTTITSFAKDFLDDADAAAVRTTLGLSNANIKNAYEANSDTNGFTDAEKTKLGTVSSNAEPNQTAAQLKTSYESNSNTNAFTDALLSKVNAIEAGATADQTDAEIETAYNNQVAQVTSAERTAGNSPYPRRFAPDDVKSMIDTHGGGYTHPNHSGDVTSSGDGATTIAAGAVTLAKMANISQGSILGRVSAGSGSVQELSSAQAHSVISHTSDCSRIVFAKCFSNTTTVIYNANNISIAWNASTRQITYQTASGSSWSYMDGSHLFVKGSANTTTTTPTAFSDDISATQGTELYISNNGSVDYNFSLDDDYGAVDRFTLIKEGYGGSGYPSFEGIVFCGSTNHVTIVLREISYQ